VSATAAIVTGAVTTVTTCVPVVLPLALVVVSDAVY